VVPHGDTEAGDTHGSVATPPRRAPVIDRKLRDLHDAGSARTGGLCRRFRRRP